MKKDIDNAQLIQAANYDTITLDNVEIKNYEAEMLIKTWTDGNVKVKGLKCDKKPKSVTKQADTVFDCKPI